MVTKQMSALHVGLRNFLVTGRYSPIIIDFDKSIVKKNQRYQILALRKPNEIAFEIENLKWPFGEDSYYGLLVFDTETQKVTAEIDLKTSFDFVGLESTHDKELSFGFNHGNFLLKGEYIMFAKMGRIFGKNSDSSGCTDIAVFHVTGKLIHAWKLNFHQSKVYLRDFKQIQGNRWFVELETDDWHHLYMLVPDKVDGFVVAKEKGLQHTVGSIIETKTDEIKCWFSDEGDRPAVFVLAGSYQLCIYRYDSKYNSDRYEKLVDTTINHSHIGQLAVKLNNNQITVNFSNKNSLLRSGKLTFSIVPDEV